MKKYLITATISIIMMMIHVAFAVGERDPELLNDMYNNPQNYVCIGGITNTGDSLYVIKPSVDVQEYAPPKYIIAITLGSFWSIYFHLRTEEYANLWEPCRFLYDYNSRKIYVEDYDKNNNAYWQYLDPKYADGGRIVRESQQFAAAELAFYFAYGMSFFDKPMSGYARRYIEQGKGIFGNL